jgi:hypothetical protein
MSSSGTGAPLDENYLPPEHFESVSLHLLFFYSIKYGFLYGCS